jgi:hypothetical protein
MRGAEKLADHPALHLPKRELGEPWTDERKLATHLRHIKSLDPAAVYKIVAGSTVVYYDSPHGKVLPPGSCCRIVLAPNGKHRRIGIVGFDPR